MYMEYPPIGKNAIRANRLGANTEMTETIKMPSSPSLSNQTWAKQWKCLSPGCSVQGTCARPAIESVS